MKAKFVHRCTHVLDKEAAIKFYEEALGIKVLRGGPRRWLVDQYVHGQRRRALRNRAHLEPWAR